MADDPVLEFLTGFLLARGGSLNGPMVSSDSWYWETECNFSELEHLGLVGTNGSNLRCITQAGLDYIERGGKEA